MVTKISLLVLDEEEHELIEQGDETEATKSNQRVVDKMNLLVLD